jgi:acetyl-CoA acetyltransferase
MFAGTLAETCGLSYHSVAVTAASAETHTLSAVRSFADLIALDESRIGYRTGAHSASQTPSNSSTDHRSPATVATTVSTAVAARCQRLQPRLHAADSTAAC